ncbi:DUF4044 domain-containing protein [bacterium]|jgi:membrane associated rhomboid family serine protease|nr:DUF4044 domain-containing protein [bacterium]
MSKLNKTKKSRSEKITIFVIWILIAFIIFGVLSDRGVEGESLIVGTFGLVFLFFYYLLLNFLKRKIKKPTNFKIMSVTLGVVLLILSTISSILFALLIDISMDSVAFAAMFLGFFHTLLMLLIASLKISEVRREHTQVASIDKKFN